MTQEQSPPTPDKPAMELLDGDASLAPHGGSSVILKLARGTMYGVVLLAATALLAVSAVPELAQYATFLPDAATPACSMAKGRSCTTLDQVSFDGSACEAAVSSCCVGGSAGSETNESVLASTDALPPCCASISRASLVAGTSADAGAACCADQEQCPLECEVVQTDEPIDAASLLAATPAKDPADEKPAEEGAELEPDQDEVEE